jgi:HAD superfamily hydrolase (TIGR01509 family)
MPIKKYPQAVFLDLDGTLINSLSIFFGAYLTLLEDFDFTGNMAEFGQLSTAGIPRLITGIKERYQLQPSVEELTRRYRKLVFNGYTAYAKPNPGAQNLLDYLASRSIRVGLVTSSDELLAKTVLFSYGWKRYFEHIIVADETISQGKPDPAPYHKALGVFRLPATATITIEDSLNGVLSAQAAGVPVAWLKNPLHAQETIPTGICIALRRLDDMIGYLHKLQADNTSV